MSPLHHAHAHLAFSFQHARHLFATLSSVGEARVAAIDGAYPAPGYLLKCP